MAALHDMVCNTCGTIRWDASLAEEGHTCIKCSKGRMEILWQARYRRNAAVHAKERTALYYSPKEKKWQYPPRSDQPVPERLRKRGYERIEFSSLRALEQHGKQTGAISERAWFDKGSGRSLDEG